MILEKNLLSTMADAAYLAIRQLLWSGLIGKKNYGYLTITSAVDARVLCIFQVGDCPLDKAEKYFHLSQEKARRLFNRISTGNKSSWQSRSERNDQWGGAICAGNVIVSFSGLPELADEAISLMTAVQCDWLTIEQAAEIAVISRNIFFDKLCVLMNI